MFIDWTQFIGMIDNEPTVMCGIGLEKGKHKMSNEIVLATPSQEYIDKYTSLVKNLKDKSDELWEQRKTLIKEIELKCNKVNSYIAYVEDCLEYTRPVIFQDYDEYYKYVKEVNEKSKSTKQASAKNIETLSDF